MSKAALIEQLQHVWHNAQGPFHEALAGISEDEATWQSPHFNEMEQPEGWPLPGSVHWYIAQLSMHKQWSIMVLANLESGKEVPQPNYQPAENLHEELKRLDAFNAHFSAQVEAMPDKMFEGDDNSLTGFVQEVIVRDLYHLPQIEIARRLWADHQNN